MLKAPSCQMKCNGPHWYHNFLYDTTTDSISTTSGHIGTLPTEHLSQQSLCNCQHIECSSFFPFQETKTDTFCSSHAKFQQFFPLINFSCKGSLFFGHSLKHLPAYCLRCEHKRFYMVSSIGLVLYIHTRPHGKLLTKQTSFLVQPYARQNCVINLHKTIFACPNLACKPPCKAHTRTTLGHFQTVPL